MDESNGVTMDKTGVGNRYFLIGLSAVLVALLWWYVSNPIIISVTGSGIVTVPASYGVSQVTVVAIGTDAGGAIAVLQGKIASVRTVMTNNNVTEENISQSQPQITPAALVVAGASGYQASTTLSFKTRYVADISNLITNLYANGATVVSQPVYLVENQEEAERTAMKEAMSKAEIESKYFAKSKWKLIRKIVAVTQASSGTSAQTAIKDSLSQDEMIIANGGVEIAKAVQVTYKMW